MGGELKLAFTLAVQMNNYDDFKSPYNFPYIDELQTPQLCASYTWPGKSSAKNVIRNLKYINNYVIRN
ncbi:uncharacterized protein OCT59_019573 [Rhizophagus irregularis]|uniref:uncharacterized protein n=1 Tax=Rhizophagus irregularis TaxID=588596 RepID=UPI003318F8C8|nr:hypothetical protein OCT59_019573 [Rhizophagus irregularis]